jgi:hypothetical protein
LTRSIIIDRRVKAALDRPQDGSGAFQGSHRRCQVTIRLAGAILNLILHNQALARMADVTGPDAVIAMPSEDAQPDPLADMLGVSACKVGRRFTRQRLQEGRLA